VPGEPTRSSLLSRLRDSSDQASWREFEERYREVVIRFCRSRGLQVADADDVFQAVLTSLVTAIPKFVYDRSRGRFRDYLFQCVRSVMQKRARPNRRLESLAEGYESEDSGGQGASAEWEREWMNHHYRLAVRQVSESLDPRSLEVFERSVAGRTPQQVASEFGMSVDAVYKVRQRVRARVEAVIAEQVAEEDRIDG